MRFILLAAVLAATSMIGCRESDQGAFERPETGEASATVLSAEEILKIASESLGSSPTAEFEFRVEESHGDTASLFVGQGITASMDGSRRRIRLAGSQSDPTDPEVETKDLVVVDNGSRVSVVDYRDQIEWSSPLYRAGGILFSGLVGQIHELARGSGGVAGAGGTRTCGAR